jgi:hypothetical protein
MTDTLAYCGTEVRGGIDKTSYDSSKGMGVLEAKNSLKNIIIDVVIRRTLSSKVLKCFIGGLRTARYCIHNI